MPHLSLLSIFLACFGSVIQAHSIQVTSTEGLVSAISDGAEGSTIEIAAGTYTLGDFLEPKTGMTIKGSGIGKTIITHAQSWMPSTENLPDGETNTNKIDTTGYLFRLKRDSSNITISNLTFCGPGVHGAIYARASKNLHLHHLQIKDVLWSGIRLQASTGAKIHDCEFIDAGGRWERGGKPGIKGGITGAGIFTIWMKDAEIFNNRFTRTQMSQQDEFYGIKGRQSKRSRIHHNTIKVNFSIEFPFENDEDTEIDHNICEGTISIPKHAGGPVPGSGKTFHIHHNYFRNSYSIEFVRNGVEINHNLFDFPIEKDHGNTISGFGKASAMGPAVFHNNLISNPARGVIWINEPYRNLEVRNNHIIARTTATPRKDGLFGLDKKCQFDTIAIRNNLIECRGLARPLFRNNESYQATVVNNTLINISDTEKFTNKLTGALIGLEKPLLFRCGVNGELTVDGWKTR